MVDEALKGLSPRFDRMYAEMGWPSIVPQKLLRTLLLQILYSVRSERMLMEQLNYNLLFRWFVELNMDEAVRVPTVFSKNRDRLLAGEVARLGCSLIAIVPTLLVVSSNLYHCRISTAPRKRDDGCSWASGTSRRHS